MVALAATNIDQPKPFTVKPLSTCVYSEIPELLSRGIPVVLATVVHTMGSTPQKAGSTAIIVASGLISGTVGGGQTEFKVIEQAKLLHQNRKSGLYTYELRGEIVEGSESICGGSMTILIDASPENHLPVFRKLKEQTEQRRKGVLLTLADSADTNDVTLIRQWIEADDLKTDLSAKIKPVVSQMLYDSTAKSVQTIPFDGIDALSKGFTLAEKILPKPLLIIAGAGHIGKALAQLGSFLGFSVAVWDDRPEYADPLKLDNANWVMSCSFDQLLEKFPIRNDCYWVIVTRGHRTDGEVLQRVIQSDAAYIGMMGSKVKVAKMKAEFLSKGWATSSQWNRIHSPVGLDIGGQTVEEIALSIAAELVKVKNQIMVDHE